MRRIIQQSRVNGRWTDLNQPKPQFKKKKAKLKVATPGSEPAPKNQKPKKHKVPNKFYKSHEWARARYAALKKSSGRCELCGRSAQDGVILNVDHIKPLHKYPELALDPSNHQVLCGTCNRGKYGDDETDWRGLTPIPGVFISSYLFEFEE